MVNTSSLSAWLVREARLRYRAVVLSQSSRTHSWEASQLPANPREFHNKDKVSFASQVLSQLLVSLKVSHNLRLVSNSRVLALVR
jgi:hypothetical protein